MKNTLIIFFLLLLSAKCLYSQPDTNSFPPVTIPGSETRTIFSAFVPGQEYVLQIHLPSNYEKSSKKYPVVYVMDSQWDFPLVNSIYGQQYFDGFIPELIVVGVTWGGDHPNPDSLRVRDYTPTKESRMIQSGGADRFLSFMKDELFPFIESNYKADSLNRTLMGCSLGGLITLYALFTHTDMFHGYVAASPAIGWSNEVIYQYEKSFYELQLYLKKRFSQRLYISVGGVERGVPGFEKLANLLGSRNYNTQRVYIQSKVLENTGHSGTKSETFSRGLQWVFERPAITLAKSILDHYSGTYQNNKGEKFEIKNENATLVLYNPEKTRFPMIASDETNFYTITEFLNIVFKKNDGGIEGFELNRFGGSGFFQKISK